VSNHKKVLTNYAFMNDITKNTGTMACDEWIGNYSNLKLINKRNDKTKTTSIIKVC